MRTTSDTSSALGRGHDAPARAHAVSASCGNEEGDDPPADLDLTPKQTKVLLHMINNLNLDQMTGEFSAFPWIIDTGASYHVTGD